MIQILLYAKMEASRNIDTEKLGSVSSITNNRSINQNNTSE